MPSTVPHPQKIKRNIGAGRCLRWGLSTVSDRCPGGPLRIFEYEDPQMQFGATNWANFKEHYCKFLSVFTQETSKGFLSLDGGSIPLPHHIFHAMGAKPQPLIPMSMKRKTISNDQVNEIPCKHSITVKNVLRGF